MRKVISFISRKGGTGKTTNAIQLTTSLHHLNKQVCLIETDTNYTISTLRNMELSKLNEHIPIFPVFQSEDHLVISELQENKLSSFDYCIIDSAGKTTTEDIKRLAILSDLIIIPTSLTQNDLIVAYQTVEDLLPAKALKDGLQIMVLPNRIHSATKIDTVKQSLESLQAIIADVYVPQKAIFAQYSTIMVNEEYLKVAENVLSILN